MIELLLGVVVGNAFSLDVPSWLGFIGSFAGIVLTFLAGAEVDVPQFRLEWRASVSIGLVSFFAPFAVVGLLCYYALDWTRRQPRSAVSRCRRRALPSCTRCWSRRGSTVNLWASG